MLYFQPGDRCWFRLTGLGADARRLLTALSETGRTWQIRGTSFGGCFAIRRWFNRADQHPWAGVTSLYEMEQAIQHDCNQEPHRIRLRFHTPTTFEEASESSWGNWMPLPVPRLVFNNLRMRVATFCPELDKLPCQTEFTEGRVALGEFHNLESQMLAFQRHKRPCAGFKGVCEFLLDRDLPPAERLWFHLLAGFAFYSGIGKFTSWGMGQALREPADTFLYRGRSAR